MLLCLICILGSRCYAELTKIWLFAIDNVELVANFDYLFIYYFCDFYYLLLKAISIITIESHPILRNCETSLCQYNDTRSK